MHGARVLLALLALAQPVSAEDLPALHDVTGVAADDVLNLRAAPDAGADIVGTFAPDATGIEVVALSEDGTWGRANLDGESSGWLSMRFLKRHPGPSWTAGTQPLTCLGTEPFWSLAFTSLNFVDGTAVFSGPDFREPPMTVVNSAAVGGSAGIVGVSMTGGFAVIRRAECSDGMSDRVFGLSLDLFLSNGHGRIDGYTGCCSVK